MKNLIENKNGNANIILLALMVVVVGFGMLTIGSYIYFSVASSADAGQIVLAPARVASQSLVFTGNVSCGQTVTVTNATGSVATFEFNVTGDDGVAGIWGCAATAGNAVVKVTSGGGNNSTRAALNLSRVMVENVTVNSVMTVQNTTNNTVSLVFRTAGTTGNSVAVTDTVTNGAWNAATLSGGFDALTGQTTQNTLNNYVAVSLPLMGLALMILGFSVLFITLRGSFGTSSEKR